MEAITNKNSESAVDLYLADYKIETEKYGGISTWDVSNVINMQSMFCCSEFYSCGVENWIPKNYLFKFIL